MNVDIEPSWKTMLQEEFEKPYFKQLADHVRKEYQTQTVYPEPKNIFRAFTLCPFSETRVVILGQDPYHGPQQAHGLSFSVKAGNTIPPSLQNIFKEIHRDLGTPMPQDGDLTRWAEQGVLLLNSILTVRRGSPASHHNIGWEQFTTHVINTLSMRCENIVFLLWGKYARKKGSIIDRNRHLVLESAHPSPFSANRGFFGCRHFSQTNAYLEQHGEPEIKW